MAVNCFENPERFGLDIIFEIKIDEPNYKHRSCLFKHYDGRVYWEEAYIMQSETHIANKFNEFIGLQRLQKITSKNLEEWCTVILESNHDQVPFDLYEKMVEKVRENVKV